MIIDEIELEQDGKPDWLLHALYPFEIGDNEARLTGQKAGMRVLFGNSMVISQCHVFEGVDEKETEGLPEQWHLRATVSQSGKSHRLVSVVYPYALGEEKALSLQAADSIIVRFDGQDYRIVKDRERYILAD